MRYLRVGLWLRAAATLLKEDGADMLAVIINLSVALERLASVT